VGTAWDLSEKNTFCAPSIKLTISYCYLPTTIYFPCLLLACKGLNIPIGVYFPSKATHYTETNEGSLEFCRRTWQQKVCLFEFWVYYCAGKVTNQLTPDWLGWRLSFSLGTNNSRHEI
jgi:hypothetical protein